MSFEIIEEKANPVVGRREARVLVHHQGSGTPDRLTVRKLASEHFKTPVDRVFVRSIATRTGGSSAVCAVEVYEDAEVAQKNVPAYLKNRNLPKDQRVSKQKKSEEAKPAAPAAPAKKAEPKPVAKAEPAKEPKPAAEAVKTAEKPGKAQVKPEPKPKA